jgi:D-xylose transport system ATP-binding protein
VILDSPTVALGVAQTEQMPAVRRLADPGVAVLIMSHNLTDEVVGYITGTKIRDQLLDETAS